MGTRQPLFQTKTCPACHTCPQPGATDGISSDLGGLLHPQNMQLLSTTNTSVPVSTSSQAKDQTGLKHPTVTMGWCKRRARCQEVFSYISTKSFPISII